MYLESHDEGQKAFLHVQEDLGICFLLESCLNGRRQTSCKSIPELLNVSSRAEVASCFQYMGFYDEET